jgi:hypothetical protein
MTAYLFPWLISDVLDEGVHSRGAGIVMCISESIQGILDPVDLLYRKIKAIRNVIDSKLPIEIFYRGEQDLGEDSRALLESVKDVNCHDLTKIFNHTALVNGMINSTYYI